MDSTQTHSSDNVTFNIVIKNVCQDRYTPADGPKDITQNFYNYLPLDKFSADTYTTYNMVGMPLQSITLRSGMVYTAPDGKRLILEVGCNTIIYLLISPGNTLKNHHFFIESQKEFVFDVTTGVVAHAVSRAAEPMVTVGKYEMSFMLGIFSTVSIGVWLTITGVDLTFSAMKQHHKMQEFKKLTSVLLIELDNIKKYAPTLHKKLMQLLIAERDKLAMKTAERLPATIAHDKMAQAKTAGILYGKYFMSPKILTVWGALITVLIRIGLESATNSPKAAIYAIDNRYNPIIRDFANTDWTNIKEQKAAILKLVPILKEDKLSISVLELEQIVIEVRAHPRELEKSLIHIVNAIKTFRQSIR